MKYAMIAFLMLFLIQPLTAQTAYTFSRAALYGGTAFDLITTEKAIHDGAIELNPILGQNRIQRVSMSGGITVAVDLLTHSARRDYPRFATLMNFLASSIHFGAGAWNLRQSRP